MNFLPKELEDIIITYKHQLEHKEKFSKTLKQIKSLQYVVYCIMNNNGRYSYTFNIDFPVILKHYNTEHKFKQILISKLHAHFEREYEHISLNTIFIKRIEHNGYIVYDSRLSDREKVMTDDYLMDTVYEDYK